MKCLRCNSEMKQYKISGKLDIYELQEKPYPYYGSEKKITHSPRCAYICDCCGYVEFNMGFDDDDDDLEL